MLKNNLLFTLFAFHVFLTFSQQKASVVVRFRSEFIYLPVTENKREVSYQLKDILNSDGMKLLEEMAPDIISSKTKVVKLFPNLSWKDSLSVTRFGDVISTPPFWATFLLECKAEDVSKTLSYLNSQQQLVLYAEMPVEAELQSYPDDLFYPEQYSLVYNPLLPNAGINVEAAWEIETGKPFVKIGVLDSGIDSLHPDLEVLYGAGYYNTALGYYPGWGFDYQSHGTAVAGIIGAKRNNGIGVAGIAGGDGSDSSGVSLIDLKTHFNPNIPADYILAATVDGARSVGSYWAYPPGVYHDENNDNYPYFQGAPGFGLHIQNHSYIIKTDLPTHIDGKDIPDTLEVVYYGDCNHCREAFLYSLKNGVINVVARGNANYFAPNPATGVVDPETEEGYFPQSFPDNWIISVGASGYDGKTVEQGVNQSYGDSIYGFFSCYGGNMDLIAPGSDSIVRTTGNFSVGAYKHFNGTSAAAPHVSGVVGLLLSYYDKDCYSNRNLTIEDVEYILEHSATDVMAPGVDVVSAHGRLNAYEALKMIELPEKQIVHPQEVVSSSVTLIDTIRIHYNKPFYSDNWGPLSRNFPLTMSTYYQVEVVKAENTYAFDDYLTPATELLEIYSLPSRSNALRLHNDVVDPPGSVIIYEDFDVSPYCEIVSIDSVVGRVFTTGYYYHFIGTQFNKTNLDIDPSFPVDFWYPANPYTDSAKLPISVYLSDSTLTGLYDFPCDSTNLAYDVFLDVPNQETPTFEVYPNPSKGMYTIRFTESGNYKIKVVDLTGRIVKEMESDKKEIGLDLTSELNGTFILTVESAHREFHRKIVKL